MVLAGRRKAGYFRLLLRFLRHHTRKNLAVVVFVCRIERSLLQNSIGPKRLHRSGGARKLAREPCMVLRGERKVRFIMNLAYNIKKSLTQLQRHNTSHRVSPARYYQANRKIRHYMRSRSR